MDWRAHITIDPRICHGKPCIKGTRVLVSVILDHLAGGHSSAEILEDFPSLGPEAIPASLSFAADLARGGWSELPRSAA